jgi:hypothetical protein
MRPTTLAFCLALAVPPAAAARPAPAQPAIGARVAPLLQADGLLFKDLNRNGRLDPYEDWRRPVEERISDLVAQMTLEEKAGLMVGPSLEMGPGGATSEQAIWRSNPFSGGPPQLYSPATTEAIQRRHIRQFINRTTTDPRTMATWLNTVQTIAEGTRLGIPATSAAARSSASTRRRVRCRSGRARSASRPRATPRSSRSSPRSPPVSTSRSGSAAPTTRRSTSRPSRAGRASTAPSGRTSAWPRS